MHTNLDAAEGGVNDVLADLFGIRQRTAFADGLSLPQVTDGNPILLPQNYVAAHPPLKQAGKNCKACSNVDIAHGYTFGSFELNGGKV